MTLSKKSPHFVREDELLAVQEDASLGDALQKASDRQAAGLVVRDDDRARVVKLGPLWTNVQERVNSGEATWERLSGTTLREILELDLAKEAVLRIAPEPVDVETDPEVLPREAGEVFHVVERGQPVGWYAADASFASAVGGRLVYICPNGHENSSSRDRYCLDCPFEIERIEVKA